MARILLVEDQHNIRLLIATLLRSRGHDIIEAEDGETAQALLQNPPPFDILITDLQIPHIDGEQLILLAKTHLPNLVTLAVSAYHDRLVDAQANGADSILTKPFSHHQLIAAITSMVEMLPD
ncbi:MAG TPA: response regulator [Oceanobacillus sp.]|nr:response regulator [Oceanobacillus sp.]